jgi:DNA-directed RNA polymerase specialized sigma24 family protein
MSANRSSISIDPPLSVLAGSRSGCVGEASLAWYRNRDVEQRYRQCGYTPGVWCCFLMSLPARERVAAAYDAHYEAMRFIATQKFRVPPADVRPLIHDVFVAFLRHVDAIGDDRGWLITATRNACLNYWRDKKPCEPLSHMLIDSRMRTDDITAQLDLARLFRRVPSHCHGVLWRRYVDGLDPGDIAAELSKKRTYGRQIVHRCLRAAREALASFRRRPE